MSDTVVFGRAEPRHRKDVERLVRICGPHVKDYFEMRNLNEYWEAGEVWQGRAVEGVGEGTLVPTYPVAFAVVHRLKREPVLSLYDIGVHPEWRGIGVASALMERIWSAEKAERLRLVVSEDNTDAIAAYVRWGLIPDEPRLTKRNGFVIPFEGVPRWA